jgi:hypothetical protein
LVVSGFVCQNSGPITLPVAGTYKLRIAPSVNDSTNGTYGFQLTNVPATQSFAYALGATVGPDSPTAGQGKIESPGSVDEYTFTATAGQRVFYGAVATPGANCNFTRTLLNPSNAVVVSGYVCQNWGPITLPVAGKYTVRITAVANDPSAGVYSFKLTNVPAAQVFPYVMGTTVAPDSPSVGQGNIEAAGSEDRYTFTATAGQKVTYTPFPLNGGACSLRRALLDPSGVVVPGSDASTACSSATSITLPATGTYTLWVHAVVNDPLTAPYSFKLTWG